MIQGVFRGCLGGVRGCLKGFKGFYRVYCVPRMAQVELNGG